MLFSKELTFSDDQAITGDAVSTNVFDAGDRGVDPHTGVQLGWAPFRGAEIPLLVQVTEDFNTLTSLTISIQTDTTSAFSSPKTVLSTTILLADLVAGKRFPIVIAPDGVEERYMRLNYDVTGTNPTAGKITAGIVHAVQTN